MFSIFKNSKKIKEVKRVCPKRKIKGQKEYRKGPKKMKENEPQEKKKRAGKCANLNATTIYFGEK